LKSLISWTFPRAKRIQREQNQSRQQGQIREFQRQQQMNRLKDQQRNASDSKTSVSCVCAYAVELPINWRIEQRYLTRWKDDSWPKFIERNWSYMRRMHEQAFIEQFMRGERR
jgi:hypothetical protein